MNIFLVAYDAVQISFTRLCQKPVTLAAVAMWRSGFLSLDLLYEDDNQMDNDGHASMHDRHKWPKSDGSDKGKGRSESDYRSVGSGAADDHATAMVGVFAITPAVTGSTSCVPGCCGNSFTSCVPAGRPNIWRNFWGA